MRRNDFIPFSLTMLCCHAVLLLPACSVNVQKEANGRDKQVDIKTPLGGVHVSRQADVSDIGLSVYPGARLKEENTNGREKSANVNLSGFGYGIKVVAVEFQSDDDPGKILSFYRDQLKKYGNVLECRTSRGNWNINLGSANLGKRDSNELTCQGTGGSEIELKVGRQNDQHIVAVEPQGGGSSFSLVYVRTHGKDADI
jgi:hypothetical protein